MKPLQTLLVSASVVALITVYVFDAVTDLFARYFTMELEVCRHYNDADATVMQVTDQYYPFDWSQYKNDARRFGSSYAEFLAFKHNIPLHVFEHESKQGSLEKFMQTGRGGASMYFPSCNVKFTRKKLNEIRGKVASASGYRPSTISYGCGKDEYLEELPKSIIGGRNSQYTAWNSGHDAITWYGRGAGTMGGVDSIDKLNIKSMPSSGRFYLDIRSGATREEARAFTKEQVANTMESNGFYVNFVHWHAFEKKVKNVPAATLIMADLFNSMAEGIQSSNISKVDYNQALEYLFLKECVDTAFFQLGKEQPKIIVRLNPDRDSTIAELRTPLTMKFAKRRNRFIPYKRLITNERIVKINSTEDDLVISVMLDLTQDENVIPLTFGDRQEFDALWEKPKLNYVPSTQMIHSSIPAKFVIFRRQREGKAHEIRALRRTDELSDSLKLTDMSIDYQYFIGAITAEKESTVIGPI